MLDSLSDQLQRYAKKQYKMKNNPEGHPNDGWIVLDLGDIVIHFFAPDQRDYYQLEELWSEAKTLLHLQ